MNLNQLHYFVTLAHIEHYTRAAEMLSITQPSLSHAISMLEQELETNLFEKRGRNVVLTKYGKVFRVCDFVAVGSPPVAGIGSLFYRRFTGTGSIPGSNRTDH